MGTRIRRAPAPSPGLGPPLQKVQEAFDAPGLFREVLAHEDRLGAREVAAPHEEARPLKRGENGRACARALHAPELRRRRVELPELLERGADVEAHAGEEGVGPGSVILLSAGAPAGGVAARRGCFETPSRLPRNGRARRGSGRGRTGRPSGRRRRRRAARAVAFRRETLGEIEVALRLGGLDQERKQAVGQGPRASCPRISRASTTAAASSRRASRRISSRSRPRPTSSPDWSSASARSARRRRLSRGGAGGRAATSRFSAATSRRVSSASSAMRSAAPRHGPPLSLEKRKEQLERAEHRRRLRTEACRPRGGPARRGGRRRKRGARRARWPRRDDPWRPGRAPRDSRSGRPDSARRTPSSGRRAAPGPPSIFRRARRPRGRALSRPGPRRAACRDEDEEREEKARAAERRKALSPAATRTPVRRGDGGAGEGRSGPLRRRR